jgi:vacuolar-type H+-ATPase subunit E/Vma4
MGLEDMRAEIRREAQNSAAEIEKKAQDEASETVRRAKEAASEKVKRAAEEAKAAVAEEKSESATAAILAAKKMLSEAREAAVEAALGGVWENLLAMRTSGSSYAGLLRRLAEQGCVELGTKRVRVLARAEDHKYLAGYKLEKAECAGGVIVETLDGSVRSDKSFEAIFSDYKDEMRKCLYEAMFAGDEGVPAAQAQAAPSRRKNGKRKANGSKRNANGKKRRKR